MVDFQIKANGDTFVPYSLKGEVLKVIGRGEEIKTTEEAINLIVKAKS